MVSCFSARYTFCPRRDTLFRMLIGSLGTHKIYRTVGAKISWRCSTCENGEPGHADYPCRGLKDWFYSMRKKRRPPERFRFTEEGAQATLTQCQCLRAKGAMLVRAQIDRAPAPTPPARTGRNAPCACGSGGKYKQCCGWGEEPEETRPPRRYWPPKGSAPASVPPPPAAPKPTPRERFVEREERRAETVRRVDAALETAHKQTEAERMARAARKLARIAAGRTFEAQPIDAATAATFAQQAAQLRAEAAQLRAAATAERRAAAAARKAQLAAAAEAVRAKRRAAYAARKARAAT